MHLGTALRWELVLAAVYSISWRVIKYVVLPLRLDVPLDLHYPWPAQFLIKHWNDNDLSDPFHLYVSQPGKPQFDRLSLALWAWCQRKSYCHVKRVDQKKNLLLETWLVHGTILKNGSSVGVYLGTTTKNKFKENNSWSILSWILF